MNERTCEGTTKIKSQSMEDASNKFNNLNYVNICVRSLDEIFKIPLPHHIFRERKREREIERERERERERYFSISYAV